MTGTELPGPESHDFAGNLASAMLASLPRSDQRRWGYVYIRGLLAAEGRKTMRRIAAVEGHPGAEQGLQQFISKSPWDWLQVRRELARYLDQNLEPEAWVVNPLVIPKSGERSIGVERQFVLSLGRLTSCQQALGIWMAKDIGSSPVDWQIMLSPRWTGDRRLRDRADIPGHVESADYDWLVVRSVLDMARDWGVSARPVVIGCRGSAAIVDGLATHGIPFLVRVGGSFPLAPDEGRDTPGPVPMAQACKLADLVESRLRPVELIDYPTASRYMRLAVAARALHSPAADPADSASPIRLTLVAVWDGRLRENREFWLSNAVNAPLESLVRLSNLTNRVAADMGEISDKVGIRDFDGRSFRGWHHHATLVSVAHAIRLISGLARPGSAVSPADSVSSLRAAPAEGSWILAGRPSEPG